MPSLSEMLAEQEQKEDAAKETKAPAKKSKTTKPKVQENQIDEPLVQEVMAQASLPKEITIDAYRGLWWLATDEHVGDKKMTRGQIKGKLKDRLLSKEGMRTLLKSLEEYVFS
jgi:hypothetical protein